MKRALILLAAAAATGGMAPAPAAATAAATSATSNDMCISPEAQKAISDCPANGTSFEGHSGKAPAVSFHGKVEDLKKGNKQNKPTNPSEQMTAGFRDARQTALKQRALALLAQEIKQLEMLYKNTPARASDRVQLLRRLAEDYVELENAAFREKIEAEIRRDELKKTNPAEAGKAQATALQRDKAVKAARKAVINHYTTVIDEYSGKASKRFAQNPPPQYTQLDEVYYYLAYEHEQAQDFDRAREVYLNLIDNTPNSKYITNAYLAFGELFFNEAQGDPSKWKPARAAYEKVVAKPPPENGVYGYAWYKLAYVHWNQGEYDRSLDAFKKTIDYGVKFPTLPNAAKLAESARRDVIPVYALSGAPREAYRFFKNISGDPASSSEKTYKMMDDLGVNYIDTGHYKEAIELYKDLITRDGDGDRSCSYQSRVSEATMALKSGNKDTIVKELDNQLRRYTDFGKSEHSAEAKFECANRTSQLLTETAMAWHLEAVGSGGQQRGTNDAKTMDLASGLYKRVVGAWKADEYSKFTFPRLVKEDWPSIYKIRYNMADLLYFREKWAECGPAFDGVVIENPQAPEAAEAAYAASLCYQKLYFEQHAKGSERKGIGALPGGPKSIEKDDSAKYKAKEMTQAQQDMVGSFSRYVCYIKPKAGDAEGQKQLVEIKYARARTYFETNRWDEAAVIFKDIAINHPESDYAATSAMLYLECANVLYFQMNPKRPACLEDMAVDVPKFIELYCTDAKATKNADSCTMLAKVQCDLERLRAQHTVEEADKGAGNSLELYEKAGAAYFALWEKYGAEPLSKNQAPRCEKLDEIVYNSARAYQAGRLVAKAIKTRQVLLNPQYKMDTTESARKATYEIGGNWQAIAVYDQAADWYERYAKTYKDDKKNRDTAATALSDAIVLRLGLGQEKEAIDAAKVFQNSFADKKAKAAQIAYAVGAHYAEQERWDQCKQVLQASSGTLEQAPIDIRLQAHATLGRCLDHSKGGDAARGEYEKVLKAWGDGTQVVSKIEETYKDEPEDQRNRRLGRVLDAVGEALFIGANDKQIKDVDPLVFPVYKGAGTKDDVLKHIDQKIKPWFVKKKDAIDGVQREYLKILELKPLPPPKWVIAAASKAGLMWGEFVTEFRRAPIPKAWEKDREMRATYFDAIDGASAPYKENFAKPALRKCLEQSVKFQYFDENSRSCEKWLSANYKKEYHIVDEFRGAANRANSGLDERTSPLVVGGQMWTPSAADKFAADKATQAKPEPGKPEAKPESK